jgi:hypothetical protein
VAAGPFVGSTDVHEHGVVVALQELARGGRVDLERVLDLRHRSQNSQGTNVAA